MAKRIVLTMEDFDALTSGEVLEKEGVKIILQDIGYVNMINMLDKKYHKLLTQ